MKILKCFVVVIIFSQLLKCHFFISQNKIQQNYKGIMKNVVPLFCVSRNIFLV